MELSPTCTKCGTNLNSSQKFCDICGTKRVAKPRTSPTKFSSSAFLKCSKCSVSLKPNQKFCDACGTKAQKKSSPEPQKEVSAPAPLTCGKCDKELVPKSKFCKHCGDPVSLWGTKTQPDGNRGRFKSQQETRQMRIASSSPNPRYNRPEQSVYVSKTMPLMKPFKRPKSPPAPKKPLPTSPRITFTEPTSVVSKPTPTFSKPTPTVSKPTPKPTSQPQTQHSPQRDVQQRTFSPRKVTPKTTRQHSIPSSRQHSLKPIKRSLSAGPRIHKSRSMPPVRQHTGGLNLNNPATRLRVWVAREVENYPIPSVDNFTSSWQDGQTITALVDSCQPGICPLSGWKPGKDLENIQRAMDIGEKALNVPPIFQAEDMAFHPEKRSCMTYISYFYKLKSDKKPKDPKPSPRGGAALASPRENATTPMKKEPKADLNKKCLNCLSSVPAKFKFCDGCGNRML